MMGTCKSGCKCPKEGYVITVVTLVITLLLSTHQPSTEERIRVHGLVNEAV